MLTKKLYRTRSTSTNSAVRSSQLFINDKFTGSKLTTNFSRESLPVLLSSEEQDSVLKIKPLFRTLLESISVFISHNCSTPQIRTQMEKCLTNVDRYFVTFYNQLNKNGGSAICFTKLPAQTNLTIVIKNSAIPFMRNWYEFTDTIKDIEQNGEKYIQNSIDKNFNSILTNLDSVMKYESYNAGIHDPVVKYIKKFQQQIWMFQSLIGKFFMMNRNQRNRAQEKIVQDMKTFSRDISMAYSTEFEKYVKGPENEKLKNSSYNAVCDIISEIRAVVLYDEDLSKIEQNLVPLNPIFQTIAENLNIAKTEQEIMKIEEEKTKEVQNEKSDEKSKSDKIEVYFDKELNIREIINRGMIAFKRPNLTSDRVKEFFDALNYGVDKINDDRNRLSNLLADRDQTISSYSAMKSVLAEETQKVSNLRGILAGLQEKNKELENELQKEKEKGNVTGLRQTAKNVLKYLRLKKQENKNDTSENSSKQEEEEKFLKYIGQTNAASDNYLIETIDNMLNDPSCIECRKCQDYENEFLRLSRILGTSTVIEEAQSLVNRLHQSEKTEGRLQQEIQELKRENSEMSMTITKILQLFNISQSLSSFSNQSSGNYNNKNGVSDAICGVVGKEVAKLTETIRKIEEDRKRDKVVVSKRLVDYFSVRIDDSLLAQIDEVKSMFNQNEKRMTELSNFCEDIERRLCLLLGVEKPNRAIFDSIRFLFSSLETRQNPLQSTVDTLQQEIATSKANLVDCERTAARILREKLQDVSNVPLTERIVRLAKQLRAIE